jgi:hypothetical protein
MKTACPRCAAVHHPGYSCPPSRTTRRGVVVAVRPSPATIAVEIDGEPEYLKVETLPAPADELLARSLEIDGDRARLAGGDWFPLIQNRSAK